MKKFFGPTIQKTSRWKTGSSMRATNSSKTFTRCPSKTKLYRYLNDGLDSLEIESIEEHLESCDKCDQEIKTILDASDFLSPQDHAKTKDFNVPPSIDNYELLENTPIGAGGFGIVWKMRDARLNRMVAVKVMRFRDSEKPSLTRRFLAEAQINSQLCHPFIVPVYDLGELVDGRGYYIMKLVEGQQLNEYFGAPTSHWMPRIRVFADICQAVGHAHQKKVVHRDLKPQNVMVGQHGEIQIMDWGLAKSMCEQGTISGESESPSVMETARLEIDQTAEAAIGTYPYMPPEQAQYVGNTNTMSDVFSLGAILCELLTSEPPYTGEHLDEVRQRACNADLQPAYDQLDRCGADSRLVAIAKHCLHPRAEERPKDGLQLFQQVNDFCSTFELELEEEKLQNQQRAIEIREARNRKKVWFVSSILAITLAVVATFFGLIAKQQTQLAEQEVAQKREALDFLVRTFERIDTANANVRNSTPAVRLLVFAFEDLKLNRSGRISRPMVRAELLFEVGRLLKLYGHYGKSEEALQISSDIYAKEKGRGSKEFFDCQIQIASNARHSGNYEAAYDQFVKLAKNYTIAFPDDGLGIAKRWNDVAVCLENLRRYEEANRIYDRVLSAKRTHLPADDQSVLLTENNQAIVLSHLRKFDRAIAQLESVIERRQAKIGRDSKATMDDLHSLACIYQNSSQFERSVDIFEEVLGYLDQKLPRDHLERLSTKWLLGTSYWKLGDDSRTKAIQVFEEVMQEAKPNEIHPSFLQWKMELHEYHLELGNRKRGLELKAAVLLTLLRKVHQTDSAHGVYCAVELAKTYVEQGDFLAARNLVANTFDLLETHSISSLILAEKGLDLVPELQKLETQLEALPLSKEAKTIANE